MLQEITNFTEDIISDIPDILHWNVKPSKGLHVFIDIDENGQWINQNLQEGKDFMYYDGKSEISDLLELAAKYEALSKLIANDMNKCLDNQKYTETNNGDIIEYPRKQIQSCSPFVVGFKRKDDAAQIKINNKEVDRFLVVEKRAKAYLENAKSTCKDNEKLLRKVDFFIENIPAIFEKLKALTFSVEVRDKIIKKTIYDLNKNDLIFIYLRTASLDEYQEAYDNYLTDKLFLKNQYNSEKTITDTTYGVPFYKTSLSENKLFIRHKTASFYEGLNVRIQAKDVRTLYYFETLLSNKVFPNPLPIFVDKEEIKKGQEMIKIFKDTEGGKASYSEILKELFTRHPDITLQKYYLLNIQQGEIVDFDFVPLFRFYLEPKQTIYNITQSGIIKNKNFEKDHDIHIATIFDFEKVVVHEIFNNSLVKIKVDGYSTNYFGNIDPKYVSGGDTMYQLILKYRKAFYDYIYKSKQNAINTLMFDDIMYNSILSNIRKDEIKGKFEWNNNIKKKINIWFSLYNLFNKNTNTEIMASKVTDLISKMRSIAKGEANLETPEEFAFGAGQIVSYLIDRSEASNKTYALLEPYLQKTKSGQLQDAIAQTISVYKHDIHVYKEKFKRLASHVLTYESDMDMKPLLKYFLAGCFSPCVIYES
jgi:CRISPR-associated protein Csh1